MAFLLGAAGTVAGTFVAWWLVGPLMGPDGWKVLQASCGIRASSTLASYRMTCLAQLTYDFGCRRLLQHFVLAM